MLSKIGRIVLNILKFILNYVYMTIIILAVSLIVTTGLWEIWNYNLNKLKENVSNMSPTESLKRIHDNIARATEVTNRVPPIKLWSSISSLSTVNAFTNGNYIWFTFAAEAMLNDDEKALIMGHETAHVILHHTDNEYRTFVNNFSNEDELMADNLGAVWADKAGYDVCKGREIFKKFYEWSGNSLNGSHPPNTIRYDNLAHYCKKQTGKLK